MHHWLSTLSRITALYVLLLSTQLLTAQGVCTNQDSGEITASIDYNTQPGGYYAPGTVVELCLDLNTFNSLDVEWVHAIIVEGVGPGWDFASISPAGTPPAACTNGQWGWYESWSRCDVTFGNCSPDTWGPGYAFDSPAGTANCNVPGQLDGDPGNNYGDGTANCGLTFCWNVTAIDPGPGVSPGNAYIFRARVRVDGDTGSWIGNVGGACEGGCPNDDNICFPLPPEPDVRILNMPCPNELFNLEAFFPNGDTPSGATFTWINEFGVVVATGLNVMLPSGNYTFVSDIDGCFPREVDIELMLELPTVEFDGPGRDEYCPGSSFGFSVSLTGLPVNNIEWTLTNDNGTETVGTNASLNVTDATSDDSGTYAVTVNFGDNCDTTFTQDVFVADIVRGDIVSLPEDSTVCLGNDLLFTGEGEFGGQFPDGAILTWFEGLPDPTGYSTTLTTTTVGDFVTILRVTTITDAGLACDFFFEQGYTVLAPPEITINPMDPDVCRGDDVMLTSTVTGTGPFTYRWLGDGSVTTPGYTLRPPYSEANNLVLEVTDGNGCVGISEPIDLTIFDPVAPPVVECQIQADNFIVFGWNYLGPDVDYVVNLITPPSTPGYTVTETDSTYRVDGIPIDGIEVTISVTATPAGGICPSVTSASVTCETSLCPIVQPTEWSLSASQDTVCEGAGTDLITITADIAALPTGGVATWSGTNVTGVDDVTATFSGAGLAPGTYNVNYSYVYLDECNYQKNYQLTVIAAPITDFMASDSICLMGNLVCDTLVYTGVDPRVRCTWTISPMPDTIIYPDPTRRDSAFVCFDLPGTYNVDLTVETDFCERDAPTHTILVDEMLPPPTVNCTIFENTRVGFEWSNPETDQFRVEILDMPGGGIPDIGDGEATFSNLLPGESVTILVQTLDPGVCGDCGTTTLTCFTDLCPPAEIIPDPIAPICLDGSVPSVPVTFTIVDAGTAQDTTISGPGVVDGIFFPDVAGPGTHTITIDYLDNTCDFQATFDVLVLEIPVSDFLAGAGPICVTEENIIVPVDVQPGNVYDYSVAPDGLLSVDPATGVATYTPQSPGVKTVTLIVTNAAGCTAPAFSAGFTVDEQILQPVVNCVYQGLDSLIFEWGDDPTADGYEVTVGATTTTQSENRIVIDGLGQEETVAISVVAISPNSCPNSTPGTADCTTLTCPDITISGVDDERFCALEANNVYTFAPVITDGTEAGTITISGDGVSFDAGSGNWIFTPDAATVGVPITVTIDYQERICSASRTVTFLVNPQPTADFTLNGSLGATTICAGDPVEVNYLGTLTGTAFSPDWDFDGAVDLGATSPAQQNITFNTAGSYTVRLTVTNPETGCVSEEFIGTVDVIAPLIAVELNCIFPTLNSVGVEWTAVDGATGYLLTTSTGDTVTLDNVVVGYNVDNLTPGMDVTITVTPTGVSTCPSGPTATIVCSSLPCRDLAADFSSLPTEICRYDDTQPIPLSDIATAIGPGTATWTGPGVARDTFFPLDVTPNEAGEPVRITLSYVEDGPCALDTFFDLEVFELPSVFILGQPEQCLGDTFTIQVQTTNFVMVSEPVLDYGGAIAIDTNLVNGTYFIDLVYETPGSKVISGTVTSSVSSCISRPFELLIEVSEPLEPLVIDCTSDLTSVTFNWNDVPNATGYEVTVEAGTMTGVLTGTSYTITGMLPEQTASIRVRALGPDPCGDGDFFPASCETEPCPGGSAEAVTEGQAICLDGTQSIIPLEAILDQGVPMGSFTWTGTGVIDNGDGTFSFDPDAAGTGSHVLTVNYQGQANCVSNDQIVMRVFPQPTVSFTPTPTVVCVGEEFSVTYNGDSRDDADFDWGFDGATVGELGAEGYLLSYDVPGDKTVSLTVTDSCQNSGSFAITVIDSLATPVPVCSAQDYTEITFEWGAVAGASTYTISINGGPFGAPQAGTTFGVADLLPGEEVTIRVIAIRDGDVCPESAVSATVSCSALPCPDMSIAPASSPAQLCSDSDVPTLLLEHVLSGDVVPGTVSWTGTGVVQNGTEWLFDRSGLPAGTYELTVGYDMGAPCTYEAIMTVNVEQTPQAAFSALPAGICSGETIALSDDSDNFDGVEITYDFGNAAVIFDTDGRPTSISWAQAGTYTISVTANNLGCQTTATHTMVVSDPPVAGTPATEPLVICFASTDPVNLPTLITGADGGGEWTVVSGTVPGGVLDPATGILQPASLAAGRYAFLYTVTGLSCPEDNAQVTLDILPAPLAEAGPAQTLTCAMGMVSLDGSDSEQGVGYGYRWFTEDASIMISDPTSQMIDVGQPGTYFLEVTNASGCTAVDEVVVIADTETPVMELEISNITCFARNDGAIRVMAVNGGRPPYLFSLNGEMIGRGTLMAGLAPGVYEVMVTDANGCTSTVELDLTEPERLQVRLVFPGGTDVDEGDEVIVNADISGGNVIDTLIWNPDSLKTPGSLTGITFPATETRMVTVTVVDELGCSATDQQMLLVRRERPVYFPNVFSPNGDNNNDLYVIFGDPDMIEEIEEFSIFDRWGEYLYRAENFQPNDPAGAWDGIHNGKFLNPQVVVFTAVVKFRDGTTESFKGDITIMR